MNRVLREVLDAQCGVVARRQALAAGLNAHDIRRLLRRREWARVHPGVYVDHTGPLAWEQRAWAAVLLVGPPAALSHESAIRAARGPERRDADQGPIHVAVDRRRTVSVPEGVALHHLTDLDRRAHWNLGPPRVRIEHAVLDVAASANDALDAIATLADAVQSRRTTAARLRAALDSRRRIPRRTFLEGVLADVASGTCSVLEHGYVDRVERPHGLPAAERQVPGSARGRVYRDADYTEYRLVVELDGRLFHDNALSRDRDLDRDLRAALEGKRTIRLGWGQVFGRPCDTAVRVGALLARGGWTGSPTPCPECPPGSVPWIDATG